MVVRVTQRPAASCGPHHPGPSGTLGSAGASVRPVQSSQVRVVRTESQGQAQQSSAARPALARAWFPGSLARWGLGTGGSCARAEGGSSGEGGLRLLQAASTCSGRSGEARRFGEEPPNHTSTRRAKEGGEAAKAGLWTGTTVWRPWPGQGSASGGDRQRTSPCSRLFRWTTFFCVTP